MVDLGALLEENLETVWNQRDKAKRMAALERLYHSDAVLYQADDEVRGLAAISDAVDRVLANLPPDFRFEPEAAALGHHGLAIANWAGKSGGAVLVTGHDVATITDGRIAALYVFLVMPG